MSVRGHVWKMLCNVDEVPSFFLLFLPSFQGFPISFLYLLLQYKKKYTGKYNQLLEENKEDEDDATIDQIERDLHRTFPTHIRFREENGLRFFFSLLFLHSSTNIHRLTIVSFSLLGSGQQALGRVLRAYSKYNPKLGYCQGMGFIAALFLMMMEEVCLSSTIDRNHFLFLPLSPSEPFRRMPFGAW